MEKQGRILVIVALLGLGLRAGGAAARVPSGHRPGGTCGPRRAAAGARGQAGTQAGDHLRPHGRELAVSLDVDSVYGVPSEIENPRQMAQQLSRILREDPRTLERRLAGDKHFVWLSRKVEPAEAAKGEGPGVQGSRAQARSRDGSIPKKLLPAPCSDLRAWTTKGSKAWSAPMTRRSAA